MGVPGLLRIFRKNTYGSPRSLVTQSREARGDEFLWGPPKSLRALGVQERKAKLGKSRGSGVKGNELSGSGHLKRESKMVNAHKFKDLGSVVKGLRKPLQHEYGPVLV